jgi:hypothetical protein
MLTKKLIADFLSSRELEKPVGQRVGYDYWDIMEFKVVDGLVIVEQPSAEIPLLDLIAFVYGKVIDHEQRLYQLEPEGCPY